jgi:UDP-2,3-diacylglucosamine hydrolase
MNKRYFFISDIHLGLNSEEIEKQKERLLVKFLYFAADNCDELFIAGDLYDYWFEYKNVYQKGYFRTLTALQDLSEKGIKIHYVLGNHDFMHKNFFEKEIKAVIYNDYAAPVLNGKRFFIAHGDGLIKTDYGYNILKKILRNKFLQRMYSLVHPDIGISIASRTSKKSRNHTSKKSSGDKNGLFFTAKEMIENENYDYVVFGHLHKIMKEKISNGYYINLGSWLDKPCYGRYQDEFEIIDWM